MRYGNSGWRLDVADELPDEFMENLRKAVKEEDVYKRQRKVSVQIEGRSYALITADDEKYVQGVAANIAQSLVSR